MIEAKSWFARPGAAFCLSLGIIIISIFILINGNTNGKSFGDLSYMITQRHYGIDAKEMERTVAVPLEDALASIPGIRNMLSISENDKVSIYLTFSRNNLNRRIYDSVRGAAQNVYETLPATAQRPEFSFSDDAGIPVWTAAVVNYPSGNYMQKIIKPGFEGIEGVAEVEVSRTGITEIIVTPDPVKITEFGIAYADIAEKLRMNDAIFLGGRIQSDTRETFITVDSRFGDIESMKDIPIATRNGMFIQLNDIAAISEIERESDIISRLNGNETAIISITASTGIDIGVLSRRINDKVKELSVAPLEFNVLYDKGKEESKALRSVFIAAVQASVLVAVASFLIAGPNRNIFHGLVCAAAIPFVSILSAGALVCFGFPADRKLLAGLSIGIGAAADAVLFSVEGFGNAKNAGEWKTIMARISAPLAAGAVTTCAALIPLTLFSAIEEIHVIAWALGIITAAALAVALGILPPLFLFFNRPVFCCKQRTRSGLMKKIGRISCRLLVKLVRFCFYKPVFFPAVALLIASGALAAVFIVGTDISDDAAENSVFVRMEFEDGLRKEQVDSRMIPWAQELKENRGIITVQSTAQSGSGKVLVTFDPRVISIDEARTMIRSTKIDDGFIFIPESSKAEKLWEIKVFGDDDETCRDLAQQAAMLCDVLPFVYETTLNFRDGSPAFTIVPDRERLAQTGELFSNVADIIRRRAYGPVIYKQITENGEIDVRLRFPDSADLGLRIEETLLDLPIISEHTRIDSLVMGERHAEPSVIRRENRRKAASFTVRTGLLDPERVKSQVMTALSPLDLPRAYTIEFDPEAIQRAGAVKGIGIRLAAALLICYMVIGAIHESFKFPLIVLAAIPPSLGIPVLIVMLSGAPMTAAAACSLVAVSGITVNASIITAGELRRLPPSSESSIVKIFYQALRRSFPILCSTSGTTIIGSLPFMFLSEGVNDMVRHLSLVTVFGVGASWICALVLIPSLFVIFGKKRRG